MLKLKNIIIKDGLISGPMAGISNSTYRNLVMEYGAVLSCCEMVSDKAICYENKKTLQMLKVGKNEHPCSLQLFGSDPISMGKAAKVLDEDSACDIIDINMGCPAPKVIKTGAGSKLLTTPELAYSIVEAVVKNTSKPVTVKLRTGYDDSSINVVKMAKLCEKAGATALTIHGRTRTQMYSGTANWDLIKQVKQAVNIPVIGNGDVRSLDDYIKFKEYSGVDAVMVARGGIGNPWLFKEVEAYLNNKEFVKPTVKEKMEVCLEQTRRLIKDEGNELLAIKMMRTIIPYYIRGFNNASIIRGKINLIENYKELEELLSSIGENAYEKNI